MADLPGYISDTELYYETDGAVGTGRTNNSVPCCRDTSSPGGSNTGPMLPPDPRAPLPVWIAVCDGGGLAPNGTDVTNSENWQWL